MKRSICLMLSMLMLLISVSASAAHYQTLPEKFSQQLNKGSGLKGAMTMTVSGEAEWVKLISPLSGVQVQLRAMHNTDGTFEYTMYAEPGENIQAGLTQIYGDADHAYLRSDLLLDTVLTLPLHGDVISSLTGIGNEQPTWYSVLSRMHEIDSDTFAREWQPVLAPYEQQIELWLGDYAEAPSVDYAATGTTMDICYRIPADGLRSGMKQLLPMVLNDEKLLKLLRTCMTDEQYAAYLNTDVIWYYEGLIDALQLPEDITLQRTLSAQGDILSSKMVFPLSGAGDWQKLSITQQDAHTTWQLTGVENQVKLILTDGNENEAEGTLAYEVGENAFAVDFVLTKEASEYQDEETRSHELTDWKLDFCQAADLTDVKYAEVDPSTVMVRTHYYSKNADNQSTTLEIAVSAELTDAQLTFAGRFRTSSPWDLTAGLPTDGAASLAEMTEAQRAEIIEDLARNSMIVLDDYALEAAENDLPVPQEAAE